MLNPHVIGPLAYQRSEILPNKTIPLHSMSDCGRLYIIVLLLISGYIKSILSESRHAIYLVFSDFIEKCNWQQSNTKGDIGAIWQYNILHLDLEISFPKDVYSAIYTRKRITYALLF